MCTSQRCFGEQIRKIFYSPMCPIGDRMTRPGIAGAILVASVSLAGCQATGPSVMASPNQWDGRYSGTSTTMNLGEVRCFNSPNKALIVRNNNMELNFGNSKGVVTIDRDGGFYAHISTLEMDGHIKGNIMTVSSSNAGCIFRDVLTRNNVPNSAPTPQVAKPPPAPSPAPPAITPSPAPPPVSTDVT